MPKLLRNSSNELYTRVASADFGCATIHFSRDSEEYFQKRGIEIGKNLPSTWRNDTKKWQYTHSADKCIAARNFGTIFNAICPVCGKKVFFYQNENGSRVFFESIGIPWEKHPCTLNKIQAVQLSDIVERLESWLPFNIEDIKEKNGYINVYFKNMFNLYAKVKKESLITKLNGGKTCGAIYINKNKKSAIISAYPMNFQEQIELKEKTQSNPPKKIQDPDMFSELKIKKLVGASFVKHKEISIPYLQNMAIEAFKTKDKLKVLKIFYLLKALSADVNAKCFFKIEEKSTAFQKKICKIAIKLFLDNFIIWARFIDHFNNDAVRYIFKLDRKHYK